MWGQASELLSLKISKKGVEEVRQAIAELGMP